MQARSLISDCCHGINHLCAFTRARHTTRLLRLSGSFFRCLRASSRRHHCTMTTQRRNRNGVAVAPAADDAGSPRVSPGNNALRPNSTMRSRTPGRTPQLLLLPSSVATMDEDRKDRRRGGRKWRWCYKSPVLALHIATLSSMLALLWFSGLRPIVLLVPTSSAPQVSVRVVFQPGTTVPSDSSHRTGVDRTVDALILTNKGAPTAAAAINKRRRNADNNNYPRVAYLSSKAKQYFQAMRQQRDRLRVRQHRHHKHDNATSDEEYNDSNDYHRIRYPMSRASRQEALLDSKEYKRNRGEAIYEGDCGPQYHWQTTSFPTCNTLHEFALDRPYLRFDDAERRKKVILEDVRVVANGYWRDVWIVREPSDKPYRHDDYRQLKVLKTIRYEHDHTPRNFDRHRRDGVAMERLTISPWVVDIYSFCGHSSLTEYADGGDIDGEIWPSEDDDGQHSNMTSLTKLRIATQAAIGLAAVHNIDKEGRPSIAHTDIAPGQYLSINGRYKLNDFNRARLIKWNPKTNQTCPYQVGNNPGKNRSPEEYAYEPQSEMVDVYSLGNIFYMLLMKKWPFFDMKSKKVPDAVMAGRRPTFYADVWNSTDPIDQVLRRAMHMAHVQEPGKRSSAREIEHVLQQAMEKYDPGRLKALGVKSPAKPPPA